jgi:acetaldehyde dehydrogenase (acetylating)
MPRFNEKQWHVWRATCGGRALDVVACGGQQARKLAAAVWGVRYAEVASACVSRILSRAEGHGPRLAPAGLVERFTREAPPRPYLLGRRARIDKIHVES